jgi:hypothetical protein
MIEMARAAAQAMGLQRVSWRPYVADSELLDSLLRARALVVTQLPQCEGMLWPSKLALAQQLPRPVLFIGPRSSCEPRVGDAVFAPGQWRESADWLREALARPVAPAQPRLEAAISAFSAQAARRFAEKIIIGSQRRR